MVRLGNCGSKAKESDQTDPEVWQRKRKKSFGRTASLGGGTPRALLNTMWWLLTQHFGLRGQQEHHQMKVEDFTLQRDDDGNEFITFGDGPTKQDREDLAREPN